MLRLKVDRILAGQNFDPWRLQLVRNYDPLQLPKFRPANAYELCFEISISVIEIVACG